MDNLKLHIPYHQLALCLYLVAIYIKIDGIVPHRSISQIQQYITQISHNAPLCNRNVHTCAHFCYKVVHCRIWDRCIVGFVRCILTHSNASPYTYGQNLIITFPADGIAPNGARSNVGTTMTEKLEISVSKYLDGKRNLMIPRGTSRVTILANGETLHVHVHVCNSRAYWNLVLCASLILNTFIKAEHVDKHIEC